MKHRTSCAVVATLGAVVMLAGCAPGGEKLSARSLSVPVWEMDNPILPLPASPLGIDFKLTDLPEAADARACSARSVVVLRQAAFRRRHDRVRKLSSPGTRVFRADSSVDRNSRTERRT
jgi:hypothetical protein